MQPHPPKPLKSAGIVFFCIGAAFLPIGILGSTPFIGVGIPFFTLGIVFLAKARQGYTP